MKQYPRIAICYDFDGTLIAGNMQENSFIPDLEMSPGEFWNKVNEESEKHDMDEVLSYMHLMIDMASRKGVKCNKDLLIRHGKGLTFFPGVVEWFDNLNKEAKNYKVKIEHYIISSGLDEMIRGSEISKNFKHIFASGFVYNENDVPIFPARCINFTTKVQYLFRINKGIKNSWDRSVNEYTPEAKRPIPFHRMIYIGDGETDIPSMKMINYKGGYSIAVYPAGKKRLHKEKKKLVAELKENNRAQFTAEANYKKDKALYQIVTSLIERIANEKKYKMNLKARS